MTLSNILIAQQAVESIVSEIVLFPDIETGGVLAGRYSSKNIIIENASGGGPNADRSLLEFVNDKLFMDKFLEDEYLKSEGSNIYLGEWHSHPQVYPKPSYQDYQSFYERTVEWNYGQVVFFIVGFIGLNYNNFIKQTVAICFLKKENKFIKIPIQIL